VRDEEEEKKGRRAQEKIKLKLEDKIVPRVNFGLDRLDLLSFYQQQASKRQEVKVQ
jgi:hypothetical protein